MCRYIVEQRNAVDYSNDNTSYMKVVTHESSNITRSTFWIAFAPCCVAWACDEGAYGCDGSAVRADGHTDRSG